MTSVLVVLCLSFFASAQISVTGIVTNDSIPLESASVIIKNSTKGMATNENGEFKLEAKKGDTLVVSYLSYETKEVVVSRSERLNIKLEEGNNLDEVIVIGYAMTTQYYYKQSCGYVITECFTDKEESVLKNNIIMKSKLYPNPSSNGIFQLSLAESYDEVKISIATISGRTIQNSTHQKFGEKITIDVSQFPSGIYIVNIIADGKRLETIKAIKS